VVTKDQDFRDGHLLARSPRQLLVVATGNVTNDALLSLFELHLEHREASPAKTPAAGRNREDFAPAAISGDGGN
jgi:hypothetical protein